MFGPRTCSEHSDGSNICTAPYTRGGINIGRTVTLISASGPCSDWTRGVTALAWTGNPGAPAM